MSRGFRLSSGRGSRAKRAGLALLLVIATALGIVRPVPATVPIARAEVSGLFGTLLAHSRDLGPVGASQRVSFLAILRDPSGTYRDPGLAAIYDPHASAFHHYLTARQWARRSRTLHREAVAARAFLARAGLATSWQPGSDWLDVSGPAEIVARVFHVAIRSFTSLSGRHFYAAARDPIIPSRLSDVITGTGHISSYPDRTAEIVPVSGLRPSDVTTAYNIPPLRSRHLNGKGITIAFIEIDGFRQNDLNLFTQHFSLPSMNPKIAAGTSFLKVQGEADLDLQIAHEIAPAARLVVYNCSAACTNNEFLHLETQAVHDNPRGIISISLGGCETAEGSNAVRAESDVFAQADALGESVLVASGDSGAYTCLQQDWSHAPTRKYIGVSVPASEPTVTAVGGTSLDLNANSTWYREQAWQNAGDTAGTGGGMSAYFSRPSWQHGSGVLNAYDRSGHREVPDVAADADPLTGAQVVIDGKLVQVGGTSQATPIWAGMMALIDQYLRRHGRSVAGFLNPAVYNLAAGSPAYPPFHDVTQGTNLVYPATPGYDLATGLGTPNAWNLARDLAAYEGAHR